MSIPQNNVSLPFWCITDLLEQLEDTLQMTVLSATFGYYIRWALAP